MLTIVCGVIIIYLPVLLTLNHSRRETILQSIFDNYSSTVPPNYNAGVPVCVSIQVYILSIDSLSDISKDFAMSIFLRQRWVDPRLTYKPIPGIRSLQLENKAIDQVWLPDLFLLNEKRAVVHKVVVPNKMLHIYPNGSIIYSIRISGTFSCDVDLKRFPLDSQRCPLIIESYGYTEENLHLHWYHVPIERKEDIILSQFSLNGFETSRCDKEYAGLNFSCVQMHIKLDRLYDYYLIETYVPTILIVVLSWVSFWISIDATPARISIGLLTVLAMTTQNSGTTKVTYFKALDVWMFSCLCFVFAALIEFAWVNVISRVAERRRSSFVGLPDQYGDQDRSLTEKINNGSKINLFFKNMANREKARNVDRIARFLFPISFLLFNIVYWIVYIYVVKSFERKPT